MIEVGQKYFYKLAKGRGRPYVGEVIRKAGIFVVMNNRGAEVRVPVGKVGRSYQFKPYNTAKNRVA